MSEKKAVYVCEKCHNVIQSLWSGPTDASCCGQLMTKQVPNTVDAAAEKHVPVIERDGNRVTVKVGDVAHPMQSGHYILFVEVVSGNTVYRHDFSEGDPTPEAVFLIEERDIKARAFCNLHGFWETR